MLFHSLPLTPGHGLSGILQGPFSEKTKAMQFSFSEVLQGIRLAWFSLLPSEASHLLLWECEFNKALRCYQVFDRHAQIKK